MPLSTWGKHSCLETCSNRFFQVVASDSAPTGSKKSSTVAVKIEIVDENDNPPLFSQYEYSAIIVDNIPYYPDPSPIVQVSAVDPDQVFCLRQFIN